MENTIIYERDKVLNCEVVLESVIDSMKNHGYNPSIQLAAYLVSGDPTFITSKNGARALIQKVDRVDLTEYICEKLIK